MIAFAVRAKRNSANAADIVTITWSIADAVATRGLAAVTDMGPIAARQEKAPCAGDPADGVVFVAKRATTNAATVIR